MFRLGGDLQATPNLIQRCLNDAEVKRPPLIPSMKDLSKDDVESYALIFINGGDEGNDETIDNRVETAALEPPISAPIIISVQTKPIFLKIYDVTIATLFSPPPAVAYQEELGCHALILFKQYKDLLQAVSPPHLLRHTYFIWRKRRGEDIAL